MEALLSTGKVKAIGVCNVRSLIPSSGGHAAIASSPSPMLRITMPPPRSAR